jgi:excisionase family DNA binding protein
MNETDTLTAEEAAAALGITPSRVRQMIRAGELEASRFGKVHVISRASLKSAEQRKTKPGPIPKTPSTVKPATRAATARNEGSTGKKRGKR